jgi:hypothetical protein
MLMTETGIVSDNASLCEAVPVCVPDFGSFWTNFAIYVNVKEFGCGQKANLSKKSSQNPCRFFQYGFHSRASIFLGRLEPQKYRRFPFVVLREKKSYLGCPASSE